MRINFGRGLVLFVWLWLLAACTPVPGSPEPVAGDGGPALPTRSPVASKTLTATLPPTTEQPVEVLLSPTPDPTRPGQLPTESAVDSHVVQYGESLGTIAAQYGTTIEALMALNGLASADHIQAGQTLLVTTGQLAIGPAEKLIPDSELVYGPAFSHFDVLAFARPLGGYLLDYREEVEGVLLDGPAIVQLVAQRFSVGPRILLSLLELSSGWVTEPDPSETTLYYPMGKVEQGWDGLFIQLSWTANQLNRGYYGWQASWLSTIELADGTRLQLAPELNAGTAAVQTFLALHDSYPLWQTRVGWDGSLMNVYRAFFGNPFRYAIELLIPPDLTQPEMALPWADGELWFLTGGPHGGWGQYSGWAALDFVPDEDELGCYQADGWVRAMAPGRVLRSENGEVLVDLDDDGFEGTGWVVLYMHIASDGRVPEGAWLETGDKIGHPSCEGGFGNGTHVHVARRYNGRWMEADGPIPFVLDGWQAVSYWNEYDGALVKGDETREACECREVDFNGILAGE